VKFKPETTYEKLKKREKIFTEGHIAIQHNGLQQQKPVKKQVYKKSPCFMEENIKQELQR
jgi:hypothetical protein